LADGGKYHLEDVHPEGVSPFIVKDGLSQTESLGVHDTNATASDTHIDFVECPRHGCGETILLTELESHIEMHGAEEADEVEEDSQPNKRVKKSSSKSATGFDTSIPQALRNLEDSSLSNIPLLDRQAKAKASWSKLFNMPGQKALPRDSPTEKSHRRLGVSELD
jgi:hypothetical protein